MVNNDPGGIYSQRLIERLNEKESLEVSLLTQSEANAKLKRSDILLVTYIPEDFSAQLSSHRPAQIIFMQRSNGGQEGQIVASMVRGEADKISR